jgi:hypothetical protein
MVEKATSGLALPFKSSKFHLIELAQAHSAQRAAPLSTHTANKRNNTARDSEQLPADRREERQRTTPAQITVIGAQATAHNK